MTSSSYVRLRPRSGMVGFIVNAYDATNYDIHLEFPEELQEAYRSVITNHYLYREGESEEVQEGLTYRCRLKGIGTVYPSPNSPTKAKRNLTPVKVPHSLIKESYISMLRRIDQQNGWVEVTISDIDVYNRLLVTLYDPVTKEDLSSILFSEEYNRLYCRYDYPKLTPIEPPPGFPERSPPVEGEVIRPRPLRPTSRRQIGTLKPIPASALLPSSE